MKVRSSRVFLRLTLCTALVTGALAGSAGPVSASCERVYVEAFVIELDIPRDVYRVGETARVEATVTREDTGMPVAGADFYAALLFEDAVVYDFGLTDATGVVVARLKLDKDQVEPGPARLLAWAEKEVADAECAALVEYGVKRLPHAFTIKR
jgi:hypothetical protein